MSCFEVCGQTISHISNVAETFIAQDSISCQVGLSFTPGSQAWVAGEMTNPWVGEQAGFEKTEALGFRQDE